MGVREIVEANLRESIAAKQHLLEREADRITEAGKKLVSTLEEGRRIFLIGNGGSAADAQHIACEMEGRYLVGDRRAQPVLALTTNTSSITAIGNDYGFEDIFARQVDAYVRKGDVLMALSTSGNSENILRATELAKKLGAWVLGITGETGGKLEPLCDVCIRVPNEDTPRIQECHILIGHTLCDVMEQELFPGYARKGES